MSEEQNCKNQEQYVQQHQQLEHLASHKIFGYANGYYYHISSKIFVSKLFLHRQTYIQFSHHHPLPYRILLVR